MQLYLGTPYLFSTPLLRMHDTKEIFYKIYVREETLSIHVCSLGSINENIFYNKIYSYVTLFQRTCYLLCRIYIFILCVSVLKRLRQHEKLKALLIYANFSTVSIVVKIRKFLHNKWSCKKSIFPNVSTYYICIINNFIAITSN